jgi:CMP-N,N'-diacetyllegionaminic acid synthase
MSNLPTQKTICIIPARGGSKGLIRKNLREVGGHPLVSWPIAAARACPLIDRVVLSTDDDEIAEAGRSYGAEIPFIRPDSISRDLTTTEETLRYSLLEAERIFGEEYDIAVFLTATDFFRLPNWVEDVVAALISDPSLESSFVANRTHKNFWQNRSGGSPNEWSRLCSWMSEYSNRQIRKPVYREDTGLACASRASLWRAGRRIGDRVKIIESDYAQCGLDIHDEFDLFLVEQSLAWLQQYRPTQLPPIPHRVDEKEKS